MERVLLLYRDARSGETDPVAFNDTAGEQIVIKEFTYSAKRMATEAPSIQATFRDYDCYDKLWNIDDNNGDKVQRYSNIYTIFNGEKYYLKDTPTSSYDNTDSRYKHTLNFLSERQVFSTVLMFDIVPKMYSTFSTTMSYSVGDVVRYNGLYYEFDVAHTGAWDYDDVHQITVYENALAESTKFSFYGNVIELAKRINASLVASGITQFDSTTETYTGYHIDTLIYDEFSTTRKYNIGDVVRYRASSSEDFKYYQFIKTKSAGAWNSSYVEEYTLPEMVITFDNNYVNDALQYIQSEFELAYYFDQKTIYIRSFQTEIGSDSSPVKYGGEEALMSIVHNNKGRDIINRMTAIGSEDNIPYYYPNPTEEGWLEPRYNGQESVELVAYTDTEAYLKNRMASVFEYGSMFEVNARKIRAGAGLPSYGYYTYGSGSDKKTRRYVKMRYRCERDEQFRLWKTDSLFTWTGNSGINSSWKRNKYGGIRFEKVYSNDTTNYNTFYTADYIDITYQNASGKYVADFIVTQFIETYYFNGNQSTSRIGFRQPHETVNVKPWSKLNSTCDIEWYDRFYPVQPYKAVHHVMVASYLVTSDTVERDCELDFHTNGIRSAFGGYVSEEVSGVICDGETWDGNIGSGGSYYSNRLTPLEFVQNAYYVDISSGADGTNDVRHRVYRCGAANSNYDSKQGNEFTLGTNSWSRTFPTSSTPAYTSKFGNRVYNTNDIRSIYAYSMFKYSHAHWYKAMAIVDLATYGLAYNGTPALLDKITFVQVKYLTPQPHLMPELYFKTGGDRRFYDAIQYPVRVTAGSGRVPDTDAGESWNDYTHQVINNNYYKNEDSNEYLVIENPYEQGKPKEHIEEFDDIKPTIKDVKVNNLRIDVASNIEFDEFDNDELIQISGDSGDILSYKHPYFFIKLRPLGFNLFDLAIDEAEMVVEFTTGSCGSCQFQVAVGEKYKQNVVCVWEYDAYKYNGQIKYKAGTLMRYDSEQLYKDANHAQEVPASLGIMTLPEDGSRTWGDVKWKDVELANIADSQKDTTSNSVWIALKKDLETFNVLMPTRIQGLVPTSVNGGVTSSTGASYTTLDNVVIGTGSEDTADRFVITHIRLPQLYVRNAEKELTKALIKYMALNNAEQFAYNIKFSRIYFAETPSVANVLNENSMLHIKYANHDVIEVYVASFTYKIVAGEALPEISVELQDALVKATYRAGVLRRIRPIPYPWGPVEPIRRDEIEDIVRQRVAQFTENIRLLRNQNSANLGLYESLEAEFLQRCSNDDTRFDEALDLIAKETIRSSKIKISQGYLEFDETANYEAGDYVIHDNRIFKFTQKHYGGSWLGTVDTEESSNASMMFKAMGYQEFSTTTNYSKDDIVIRNNRLVKFTEAKSAGAWDESKVDVASIALEDRISRGIANTADGKANNLIINQGYPEFSTSVAYLKDTVVKKDGLLYRFTSNKSAGAWDANKVTQTNIGAEDGISRQVGKDADTKASNILTDLGFQLFDSTRSYSENEIVVYNNRLYRFTTSKSVGNWDVSKVALDSVANCVFRSLGLEEYNSSSTQTIRRGTSFFKNGKAFIATQDFIPSQVGVDVSRVTNPYNVVAMTATDSDTKALSQTVEVLRQTVSSLNSQILDKDNGLATIVRGVNSRLATLTDDMATLADAIKDNEYLAQDEYVTTAAAAVSNSANAATTELTGADDSSTYNKMADVYTKEMFGAAVGVVHGEFSDEDSEYKFTKMVYNNSQYSPYKSKAFVEFSGENNYDVDEKVVYNKHLYIFTSAYDKKVESGEWNPSLVENIDDYLIKAVFLSTDAYNITSGSDFLEYGRFLDANTFCDHIYELVIKCGEAGIIYTELQKVVGEECKELVDGNDLNMITEHVWVAGGYTVLQYASLRLEMNDKIYVAAIYKEDYTRDDAHHILFDIKYIESMTVKTNDTIKDNGKTAEYNGEMYFVLTRDELAKTIGDNYLYCADYEVDENILLFLSSIKVDGTTLYNCYLLKKE